MTKLIAIDIDGTLLNSNREITEETIEAIGEARELGIQVVLCSGRPRAGMSGLLEKLNMNKDEDIVISFNGVLASKVVSDEVLSQTILSYQDLLKIDSFCQKNNIKYHIQNEQGIYTTNVDVGDYTVFDAYINQIPLFVRTLDEMKDIPIYKINFAEKPETLDSIMGQIPVELTEEYTMVRSSHCFVDILNKSTSKGQAVAKVAEYLGIAQSEVMAIGDNDNDISMIEYAGIGVVMENGSVAAKSVADYMTKSNNENGVAYAIREYALKLVSH